MVRGRWMHRSGVGLRGDVGPMAPIVLGMKRRSPCSAVTSRTLCNPKDEEPRKETSVYLTTEKRLKMTDLGD